MNTRTCALCYHPSAPLYHQDRKRSFYKCPHCDLIFVPVDDHISEEMEKARYDLHQNNPEDEGYRNFLSRVMSPLVPRLETFHKGLDYGSGPEPALALMFREMGIDCTNYDPFYHDRRDLLAAQYDFVTCTEVVEHFRSPRFDWERLIGLVKPGGWLAVMTQTTPEEMRFEKWYYQRDETHVAFYTGKTFHWIADTYQLLMELDGQSVILFQC